ncbi:MAG: insulinase family protein [Bacteroidetes bacterium]|nr:insulinase family protein [Bacteroidota bacterium]
MKKFLIVILFASLLAQSAAIAGNILPYPILQKDMPNGLKVVTIPYDSPGIVAFYIVVRVGSRDEVEPGKTGFAHFFEHMMFRGTDKYSKKNIQRY